MPPLQNATSLDGLQRNIALLAEFGRLKKRRCTRLNLHDHQVARTSLDWRESLAETAPPGDRFVRLLRYTEDGIKFVLTVNDEFFAITGDTLQTGDVTCSFGQPPRSEKRFTQHGPLTSDFGVPVFIDSGSISQNTLCLSFLPLIKEHVNDLHIGKGESLHVRHAHATAYLRRTSCSHLVATLATIRALLAQLPLRREEKTDLQKLPTEFHGLIPMITKWGITDDGERSERLSRASVKARMDLVKSVSPHLAAINCYLNSFGSDAVPDHACMLGALAEGAAETQVNATGGD